MENHSMVLPHITETTTTTLTSNNNNIISIDDLVERFTSNDDSGGSKMKKKSVNYTSIHMAHQVYLDLYVLKHWYSIEFGTVDITTNTKASSEESIVVLFAKESEQASGLSVIIPSKITLNWSIVLLAELYHKANEQARRHLVAPQDAKDYNNNKETPSTVETPLAKILVILCFLDQDSSLSYYRMAMPTFANHPTTQSPPLSTTTISTVAW
ncbi:hypothetical protein SAMD00019534_121120, partial [Acytostelium subglobosum LB1]|uniref:hypothetical protein n=1 Tax=Acytostelium subglobosum LB1 TaxID=1410327 RepID=UPI000644E696